MVRTKAGSVSTKAVGAKAPQKVAITAILSGNATKGRNHSGGNSYHPRETPDWQKPITFFMKGGESSKGVSKDEDEDCMPSIAATKSSKKKTLETNIEVEVTEEVEVQKKKIKFEKSETTEEILKKPNEKDVSRTLEDTKAEDKEDQGIPGISATDSSNNKILEADDDMKKERKPDRDKVPDKENEFKKIDTTQKKNLEVQQDKDEDKENQFKKDDSKKEEAAKSNENAGKN